MEQVSHVIGLLLVLGPGVNVRWNQKEALPEFSSLLEAGCVGPKS